MNNLVSGRVARGSSGYTIPGLSLTASPASLYGLVIHCLAGSPEKGLVKGCCKAGEERPNPELLTLGWVAVESCLFFFFFFFFFLYCICIKPANVVGTGLSLVGP